MTEETRPNLNVGEPLMKPLYCPRCGAGLGDGAPLPETCATCGAAIDGEELRRLREDGADVGSRWEVFRRTLLTPKRFFASLPSPRHYVRVPRHLMFFDTVMPVTFFVSLLAAIVTAMQLGGVLVVCVTVPPVLGWAIGLTWAHLAVGRRLARQLTRAGHEEPSRGVERIVFLSSAPYATIGSAFFLLMIALGSAALGDGGMQWTVEMVAALVLYGLAWIHWGWVLRRAWQAETRGLGVGSWRVLANAGLLILLLPAFLAVVAVASYLAMVARLLD